MITLYAAVLTSAVAGSLHCGAMCGPLASVAIGGKGERVRAGAAYAGGRLLAYATIGAIAGALGAGVDVVGDLFSFGRLAMVVAGVFMVGWGAWSLLRALGVIKTTVGEGNPRPMLYAIRRKRPAWRGALMGLLTAALPCGWLYAFVAVAAGTGAPLAGALVMASFWLGSTPATLGAGAALRALGRVLGTRVPVVTAALQIVVGVLVLASRMPLVTHGPRAGHAAAASPGAAPDAAPSSTPAVPEKASCH